MSSTIGTQTKVAWLAGKMLAALAAFRKRGEHMPRIVGWTTLVLVFASSPLRASTITFERGFGDSGSVTYSPTNAAVTVMNWAIDSLFASDGILPDPVEYDVDGTVDSIDPGGAGALEFFIDGCVPHTVGFFTSHFECTPTVASYIQIVGSVPDLGIPLQSLLIGDFIGGSMADRFSLPSLPIRSISGGGTDTLSPVLSMALGFDATALWNFSLVLNLGLQFDPSFNDRVVSTNGELSAVPEPSSIVLLGTGALACARRLRRRPR